MARVELTVVTTKEGLRFDERVVIVTGAGRGLGRAYAWEIARRGGSVVVNDLGTDLSGGQKEVSPADDVVKEIVSEGGAAVGNTEDVSSPEGAASIIQTALSSFGRIDGVVNNAGTITASSFPEVEPDELMAQLRVHVVGSFNVTKAAWPELTANRGSVILSCSTGILGSPFATAYNIAKGGVLSMMRSLSVVGSADGVRVNAVLPSASTRMQSVADSAISPHDTGSAERVHGLASRSSPEMVVPVVAYLLHPDSRQTGEMIFAGRGHFSRFYIASGPSYLDAQPSVESIAAHWDDVLRDDPKFIPGDVMEHRERVFGIGPAKLQMSNTNIWESGAK